MDELYDLYDELRDYIYESLTTILALIIAIAGAACFLIAMIAIPFTALYATINKKKSHAFRKNFVG